MHVSNVRVRCGLTVWVHNYSTIIPRSSLFSIRRMQYRILFCSQMLTTNFFNTFCQNDYCCIPIISVVPLLFSCLEAVKQLNLKAIFPSRASTHVKEILNCQSNLWHFLNYGCYMNSLFFNSPLCWTAFVKPDWIEAQFYLIFCTLNSRFPNKFYPNMHYITTNCPPA